MRNFFRNWVLGFSFLTMLNSTAISATKELQLSNEEFFKVRCSLDARNVFLSWEGRVYLHLKNERHKHLFDVVGVNLARCFKNAEGELLLTSRELMYYLDPATGKVLHRWDNPYIEETVPVMHVANSMIQFRIHPDQNTLNSKAYELGDSLIISQDIHLTYPNALAQNTAYALYSGPSLYQASEMFKYVFKREDLSTAEASVEDVTVTWDRIGPILPWMKMGQKDGTLIYTAQGRKLTGFDQLPALIQTEILTRVPLYLSAPSCFYDKRNVSSWTYFDIHFEAYLNADRFPVSESSETEPCLFKPGTEQQ